MKKLKKAFTLVELMVVITVIAILMTIAIVSFTRIQKQSRDTKRKADMRTIATALQAYYTEMQVYPTALADLAVDAKYMPIVPSAPLGSTGSYPAYAYVVNGTRFNYALCTNLETASESASLWIVDTTNPGGYGIEDAAGACVAPETTP